MKKNPKSEGRNPKEGRDPKSEIRSECGCAAEESVWGYWEREENTLGEPLVLREEGSYGEPKVQDLMERTARFGETIIAFAKKIPKTSVNERLISQLVGAGTSIGANYCEADDSVSGKEFKGKIGICRKESKETMFFLRMIATAEVALASEARKLWREAKELNLIFGAIWRK